MAFFNQSRRTGTLEEVIGRHEDGTILQGEADMYVRIQKDCEKAISTGTCGMTSHYQYPMVANLKFK